MLSENVDRGQVVGAQSQVAVFASSDRARIEVAVLFERLRTLDVPGIDGVETDAGSTATVRQALFGLDLTRQARVVGLGGQLDPQTRTATLLLSVEAPLDPADGDLPLLIGAFVDVTLDGRTRDGALTVPRSALYNGDTVWVVNDEERLESRTVTTGWSLSSSIEVDNGLQAGDRVVTPVNCRVRWRGPGSSSWAVRPPRGELDGAHGLHGQPVHRCHRLHGPQQGGRQPAHGRGAAWRALRPRTDQAGGLSEFSLRQHQGRALPGCVACRGGTGHHAGGGREAART